MVEKVLWAILSLLLFHNTQGQNPPVIKDSFIAWGEIVQPVPETDNLMFMQISFEESYDTKTQNAAFFLYLADKNLTFVKNYGANQTFLYEENNATIRCFETSEQQWEGSDFAPGLLAFEDNDGTVKFSLAQLLNISDKYVTDRDRGVSTTYRGIAAKSWIYEINIPDEDNQHNVTITIQSYWSDGTWNTSSEQAVTPLGFNVTKVTSFKNNITTENYAINVFGFVRDAYDHKFFEPMQGIVCETRYSTIKFPNVKNILAISLHSEMALPDYQELRYIDTWFDPVNQLVRIDVERLKDENPMERKQKHYQSEIAIGKMGIVYRFGFYKGVTSCEVIPFDKYENDFQNMFDIKQDLKSWKMGKIFGLNDTTYTYIGQTTKNDIPCHLFQGIRTDWPDKASNIKSLWEWCFNYNISKNDVVFFRDKEIGLINANVIILSEGIYKNYRMNHHFYEVKDQNPKILDSTSFDIGKCFSGKDTISLQFYLTTKVDEDNKQAIENATSDINFLQLWKEAIYNHSGLQDYSLRISNVRATIDDGKVYIKFSILNVHKDLPQKIKDMQIASSDAEKNLRDNINNGKVSIKYQLQKGKLTTLQAEKQSVSYQIDPKFEPQTVPPLPPTTPVTDHIFSLRTDDYSSTTPKNLQIKYTGHQRGAVAGIAVAMLLVGISIGASGTFYKYNGLPECMKR